MNNRDILKEVKPLLEPRIYTLKEIRIWLDEIINQDLEDYKSELLYSKNDKDTVIVILQEVLDFLNKKGITGLETFVRDNLTYKHSLKLANVCHPIRVAISGKAVSLPLFQSMSLIGTEICTKRINKALERLNGQTKEQEKEDDSVPE